MLHALRIPLSGLFIGSVAVIFISLIGYYSESRKDILKSMMIVLLVKLAVSPHTPPMAYLAVSLQGVIGSLMFLSVRFFRISTLIFGIVVLGLSSLQKIILLTIIYGNNLWYSLDQFGIFITEKISFINTVGKTSLWLIGIYTGIHLLAGVLAGLMAGALPGMVKNVSVKIAPEEFERSMKSLSPEPNKRKKRMWFRKPSAILIIVLAVMIVILTYIFPEFSESMAIKAVVMIIRAVMIMVLWFFVIAPFVIRKYKKFFQKREGKYAGEVKNTLASLPLYKAIVVHSWKMAEEKPFFGRVKEFMVTVLVYILRTDEREKI
ncbi:MAG: hypothetical protein ABFR36_10145 [Acidobacteriota bacterium]